jgi:exodeoxyribonuclease V beta subunit
MVWGRFNKAETSAPAYLFHPADPVDSKNLIKDMASHFKDLSQEHFLSDLEQLSDRSDGSIHISKMPDTRGHLHETVAPQENELVTPVFNGSISQQFRISSFSSLVSEQVNAETADYDIHAPLEPLDRTVADEDQMSPSGIFAFPKGAGPGIFMHDVFEHLDFAEKDPSYRESLVTRILVEHGYDLSWNPFIRHMINNVLSTQLGFEDQSFTLSQIPCRKRINELGFYFPIKTVTSRKLRHLFETVKGADVMTEFPRHLKRLEFSPVKGFMRGFIDMVFQWKGRYYLVDWKSNYLGPGVADYHRECVEKAMIEHFYILQYHIYCMALYQYLKVRLADYDYEKHFGGVFYLFLRGMDPEMGPDYGIYRDRPPAALIERLCGELIENRG